jgi:hypothetical protein
MMGRRLIWQYLRYKELDSRKDRARLNELKAESEGRPLTAAESFQQRHLQARLGAKKELTSQKGSTPLHRVEQDNKPKKLSPPLDHSKGIPTPEARPTTIEGWTVHEVSDGVAVLEGPNGIWRAKRGDAVPGVGRVESIVRWGNYWVVATSNGLVSTP